MKCEACNDKGWILVPAQQGNPYATELLSVERCDACEIFSDDLHAATGFLDTTEGARYDLCEVIVQKRKDSTDEVAAIPPS